MRTLLVVLLVAAMAVTASAGDNPDVYAYISFDPAGSEDMTTLTNPWPYTVINAYVCLGSIQGGMRTFEFGLNNVMVQCPGVMASQAFVNLLPGGVMFGDPFAGGAGVASFECMDMNPVIVGYGSYFYMGGACCIEILDHVDLPRWVGDCQYPALVDLYCLQSHGIINGGACGTGTDWPCPGSTGVEEQEPMTWSMVKTLYR